VRRALALTSALAVGRLILAEFAAMVDWSRIEVKAMVADDLHR
jgi:hypothetical protein